MQTRPSTSQLLRRTTVGAVLVGVSALTAPAVAGAETVELTRPTVTFTVTDSTFDLTLENPNSDPTSSCGAFVVQASKLSALEEDPSRINEPGFLTWRTARSERVAADSSRTYTFDVPRGFYAVVGECVSPTQPKPSASDPQVVSVPRSQYTGSSSAAPANIAGIARGLFSGGSLAAG
ncbi:hypothetical protein AB4Z09_03365 [Rhodococcus sp. TAF43]|uniref:hypothetical protein n=1 Tax=unclassified Rhodococcus (in: high G+C Gram-positive bacteria) TaxID=192944 RepID=UPI000E2DA956|nr:MULTISPECIES: hypothetical protein [unclassified Rhodococcus (in: high G+C Gram-positive bacteria)]QKT12904.1 hypothetical protein HUN07_21255 [Rhodococcus sp. W8901]RDI33824.1 hypothetical protein DEU38_102179 [Rhodococcus sp. AG1013]